MGDHHRDYDRVLTRASEHARAWLSSVPERPVGPQASADDVLATLSKSLPEEGVAPDAVVDDWPRPSAPD